MDLCPNERLILAALAASDSLSIAETSLITGASVDEVRAALRKLVGRALVVTETPERFSLSSPRDVRRSDASHSVDHDIVVWCRDRIRRSPGARFVERLANLVNRRGRYTASHRLRASAVRDLADHLFQHGVAMSPDYRGCYQSPGIGAYVVLSSVDDLRLRDPFTRYSVQLGLAVADSDAVIVAEELAEIRGQAGVRLAGLSLDAMATLGLLARRIRTQPIDVAAVAAEVVLKLSPSERQLVIQHLFDVAMADGLFLEQEEQLLRSIHELLGTDVEVFETLVQTCRAAASTSDQVRPKGSSCHMEGAPITSSGREVHRLYALLSGASPANEE